jgi:hypothetical protein
VGAALVLVAVLFPPVAATAADPPRLSIGGARIWEGDSGFRRARLAVTLSAPSTGPVSVDFTTVDGTASADHPPDYTPRAGTLTIAPGATTANVPVLIQGNLSQEPTETLTVTLSNPIGATLGAGTGTITIVNDDDPSTANGLTVSNVTVVEGDAGAGNVRFTVSLSEPVAQPVTVDYATENLAGTAPGDYVARSGTLTFTPGRIDLGVDVPITRDTTRELTERFLLRLSNATNAGIARAYGFGSIFDEDFSGPTPPPVPVATVDAPRNGHVVHGTYNVRVSTTGTVDRVDVYVDDVLVGQATGAPDWRYSWDSTTVPEGSHKVQARAFWGNQSEFGPAVYANVRQFLPGQIIDWDDTTAFPAGGWLRLAKLKFDNWLAASVHGAGVRRTNIGIYRSTDKARTWTKIANIDNGERLLDNPHLLRLPNGEVLLATRNWVTHFSYRLSVWRSSDEGAHWTGPVTVAANDSPTSQYVNVSEPWLFLLPDGRVSMMFADATEAGIGFRQKIAQLTSPDGGRTWPGPRTFPVAVQDDRTRPGMPVVVRMTNGQYMLLFEAGGTDNYYVHYKRSNDGVSWGSPTDQGTRISTSQQCGPGAVSLADGRVVVTSCTRAVSYSEDYGTTWKANDPAFTSGNWPALYEIQPGVVAYANTGPPRLRFGLVKPR